jgi:nuclear transport factor 2 (NTF2) superfamily protein
MTMTDRPPLPPFTRETALQKVQAAEDAWNTRDPERAAQAYSADSIWRNRDTFVTGRAETPVQDLVRLAKIRWRIEHDYRELKHGLGLDHFEGRSYIGWHRHVTLTALAQAFCTQLRYDPKAPAPA